MMPDAENRVPHLEMLVESLSTSRSPCASKPDSVPMKFAPAGSAEP